MEPRMLDDLCHRGSLGRNVIEETVEEIFNFLYFLLRSILLDELQELGGCRVLPILVDVVGDEVLI